MPCLVNVLMPDGTLTDVSYTGASLAETARYEPHDGVYTITNTYQTHKVLKLKAHLDRLEDSARRANIPLKLDRPALRSALRQMIDSAGWGDVRFRITVGAEAPDRLILSLEPFTPISQDLLAQGVRCITAPNSARHNPEAKTTDWMHQRTALQNAMPAGIYDTFLLDSEGYILEGLASNVYAIHDGILHTAEEGVLKGISRQVVLEVALPLLPISLTPVHVDDIPHLQEAFLSSSSRGIVPVVEIDGKPIGAGVVGERTKALRRAYDAWVQANLEEL
jgi:branched-chain amino acid aminotransferase